MSSVSKAVSRSNAISLTAAKSVGSAIPLAAGVGDGVGSSILGNAESRSTSRRYGLFRGWLYSAVNTLCQYASSAPVCMAQSESDNEQVDEERRIRRNQTKAAMPPSLKSLREEFEVIKNHAFLDTLEKPNQFQSRSHFVYMFVANLALTGRAYIIGGETKDGGYEFFALPSSWVQPDHSKGPYSQFKIQDPKKPQQANNTPLIPAENVEIAYLPNPGDPLGAMAPVESMGPSLSIDTYIQRSQQRFFENGLYPSAVVTVGKDPHPDAPSGGTRPRLTATQRAQIHAAINAVHTGVVNHGKPVILDGLIESITRFSNTANEMGWEKSEQTIRARILATFGVHPFMLGEALNIGGYAQASEIKQIFFDRVNCYLDMLSLVMSMFSKRLIDPEESKTRTIVYWEQLKAQDPSIRSKMWDTARKNGDVLRNEYRAELGLTPLPDGDEQRSKILDTPNGIGAVVQLVAQVNSGAITPESGAQILALFLDIPLEDAQQLVGDGGSVVEFEDAVDAVRQSLNSLKMISNA